MVPGANHLLIEPREASPAGAGEWLALVIAYLDLLVASWDAEDERLDPRHNAVPLETLRRKGVGEPALLWLLYQGHAEHLRPSPRSRKERPHLVAVPSLLLDGASRFALTREGVVFAEHFLAAAVAPPDAVGEGGGGPLRLGRLTPRFDVQDRVWTWGRHLLKEFRQRADNQVLVLCAAEELAWPAWLDDPLPPKPWTNPKVRLHDTIKALNREQRVRLIHFKGDGTGTRVGWGYR